MKIKEIECKSVLNKTGFPADYCINPYRGCAHACIYCYARFMKRFTGHTEPWGSFVDIKINAVEVLKKELSRTKKGSVFLGTVTDIYQPLERKYKLTRGILETLLGYDWPVSLLTKSNLVVRDIDLLKKLSDVEVGLSITTLDAKISCWFEPRASLPRERIGALKKLHSKGIRTYAFLSPMLPGLVNFEKIFSVLKGNIDYIMAEELNTSPLYWRGMKRILQVRFPKLLPIYQKCYFEDRDNFSQQMQKKLKDLAKKFKIPFEGYYIHNKGTVF